MVRRSKKHAQEHEDEDSLSEEVEDFTIEIIEPGKPIKKPRVDEIPWVLKYEPHTVSEVSINPRKTKEVRDIFTQMVTGESKCRILIFSGPSGASKSTLAKCLAKELFASGSPHPNGYVEYFDSSLDNVNQAQHFREFLDGCRYLVGRNQCAVLIEDLPNVFHEDTLNSFRKSLREWVFTSPDIQLPPIILCLTEVEIVGDHGHRGFYNIDNCLTVETMLGRDLLSSGLAAGVIKRIKFLPVAKTYIKKSLQRVLGAERALVGQQKRMAPVLEALYESGDIRSSLSNLEFMSKSSSGLDITELMRETQLSLFHAVGKVIHSSTKTRAESDEGEYSSDYQSVQSVIDNYHNMPLLHLALLENYQIYNGSQFDISIAASIVDNLSINDTMTVREMASDFAIRATRNELAKAPVKSGRTLPMKFPRQFKSVREENKVRAEVGNYVRYLGGLTLSFNEANLLDGYFVPRIKNSVKFHRMYGKTQYSYNRIGGSFREIYADDDLQVMENEFEAGQSVRDQFMEDIAAVIRQQQDSEQMSDSDVEESDAIEDSDNSSQETQDDELDDTLDDNILQFATQAGPTQAKRDVNSEDEFSDDPQLAFLVSQGKL